MNNKLKFVTGGKVELSKDGTEFNFFKGEQFQGSVNVDDREGVRGALYNLTGTSTEDRITPDITPVTGAPTANEIKIKEQQKRYEEEQFKLLRTPNRENATKKIRQIFNTSKGNKFWGFANNPGNVTVAFQNSTYADAGMKFELVKGKKKKMMEATWNGKSLLFDTEHTNFQSAFLKWFLEVVDFREVASFNQLPE